MKDLQTFLFKETKGAEKDLERMARDLGTECCLYCACSNRLTSYMTLLKRAGLMRAYQKWKKGKTDD